MEISENTPSTTENQADQEQGEDQPANQQAAELIQEPDPQDSGKSDADKAKSDADTYFKERLEKAEKPESAQHNFNRGLQQTEKRLAKQGKELTELKETLGRIENALVKSNQNSDPAEDPGIEGDDDDYLTVRQAKKLAKKQAQAQAASQQAPPPAPAQPVAENQQISLEQATNLMAENVRATYPVVKDIGGDDRAIQIVKLSLPKIQDYIAHNPGLTSQAVEDHADVVIQAEIKQLEADGMLPKAGKKDDSEVKPTTKTGTRNLVPTGVSSPTAMKTPAQPPPLNAHEARQRIYSDPKLRRLSQAGQSD